MRIRRHAGGIKLPPFVPLDQMVRQLPLGNGRCRTDQIDIVKQALSQQAKLPLTQGEGSQCRFRFMDPNAQTSVCRVDSGPVQRWFKTLKEMAGSLIKGTPPERLQLFQPRNAMQLP